MSIKDTFSKFTYPTNEYRGKPFWSWNGELNKEEAIRQAKILGEMGFGGYFMHSRCGLITEYLGDEWFEITNAVADESEKSGLEAWLYDEDRWPSGSAGGKVSENPKYRMKSLYLFETDASSFKWEEDVIFAFTATLLEDKLSINGYKQLQKGCNVTEYFDSLGEGEKKVLAFKVIPDSPNSNYNGNTYIDTLSYEAVDRFIQLTHEAYKKNCGDRMGSSIKGIFTDEPHRGKAMDNYKEENGIRSSAIFYTDDIFEEFEKRYGYDVTKVLPEIFYRLYGEHISKARIDYFDLGCNLLNERFAVPINRWCEENGITLTGHVLHEDSLTNQTVPNGSLMRFYENMGNPGIDILGNGNRCYWVAKQCASVCRQLGKKWMLSELYGCSGWEFTLRSHKTLGDWQTLFGVNIRCPHLSWYTMEGEGKRDYPASVSYQSPYYKDYSYVETYFARLGLMLSEGSPLCDVLVINPIESVWATAHLSWANWITPLCEETHRLEKIYTDTFMELAGGRIDFDYGEEQIMAQKGKVEKGVIKIGLGEYKTVVVSGALTLRYSTYTLLKEFLENGGKVVFAGDVPQYIDGKKSSLCKTLLQDFDNAVKVDLSTLATEVEKTATSIIKSNASPLVFNQIRKDGDNFISVWMNRDENNSTGIFEITAELCDEYRAELWSAETGERRLFKKEQKGEKLTISTSIEPAGMVIIVFTKATDIIQLCHQTEAEKTGEITEGEFAFTKDEPNVAVLDYAQYKFESDECFGEIGEILKIDRKIRDRVGIERRGGEMLQPWFAKQRYTEIYGKITVRYPFNVEAIPETAVYLAAERPEKIQYYCNGVPLKYTSLNNWWVDNSFIKMEIPENALKKGENEITAVMDFKRETNLEAVYILGEFGVKAKAGASTITKLPETLSIDNMANRLLPFYSGRTTLNLNYKDYAPFVDENAFEILVKIPDFCGANVTVEFEDKKQVIAWEPYTATITEAVKKKSPIKITLVNTRRNSFGPLHIVPTIHGAYGPEHFLTEGSWWSDEYSFIESKIGKIQFFKR